MKAKVFIKELPRQRHDRRATKSVNDKAQYRLDDFQHQKYGVRPRC